MSSAEQGPSQSDSFLSLDKSTKAQIIAAKTKKRIEAGHFLKALKVFVSTTGVINIGEITYR